MINARSETAATKPAFRDSLASRRCLIPADGFYEWQRRGKAKQPFCFEVNNGELFAFAGLWDRWKDPSGPWIKSCSILTTTPNAVTSAVHDRMPVILDPDNYDLWLDPGMINVESVSEMLKPYTWTEGQETKTIPSNFFSQPDTEHVSAVLANPEGTISKFNRMGFLAGFGDRTLKMTRAGLCYLDSAIPAKFEMEVHVPGYSESWSEGVSVYHNPNAKVPLPPEAIPGVAHFSSKEGRIVVHKPRFQPFGSITIIVQAHQGEPAGNSTPVEPTRK
jgi:hypothetical protein